VAPLGRGEEIEAVDQRLEAFAAMAVPALASYVPD
jgi:hypothetical protein